ncbi:unnamed protein product [Paramecium octaurelia]|uniref:Uncharacterized protein n=1 Tax=Paramecium octaurelia TaxID=43137 RepID=A0A8S1XAH2_PAROT|nr:unnamed protein product [Paramecium octaurelia]
MQINDKKTSKSRILIEMINNYQKPVQEIMLLEKSKLKSIQNIEERFLKSETNRQYVFPRTEEEEQIECKESPKQQQQLISLDNITNTKAFKELMNKIYQINTSKQKPKNYQQTEFIKKQYSIQSQLIRKPTQKQSNQIKTEMSDIKQNRQDNSSFKQMSITQSRGQSPHNKLQYSNRSISSQLTKFLKQKKNCPFETQDQNSQRSFELRQQLLNKSQVKLQQNKSYDFVKSFYKMKMKNESKIK